MHVPDCIQVPVRRVLVLYLLPFTILSKTAELRKDNAKIKDSLSVSSRACSWSS